MADSYTLDSEDTLYDCVTSVLPLDTKHHCGHWGLSYVNPCTPTVRFFSTLLYIADGEYWHATLLVMILYFEPCWYVAQDLKDT